MNKKGIYQFLIGFFSVYLLLGICVLFKLSGYDFYFLQFFDEFGISTIVEYLKNTESPINIEEQEFLDKDKEAKEPEKGKKQEPYVFSKLEIFSIVVLTIRLVTWYYGWC